MGFEQLGYGQLAIGKNMIKRLLIAAIVLSASAAATAQILLPFQFQAGQPARAADVNANFSTLVQEANKGFGMVTTQLFVSMSDLSTSVASATCPVNTLPVSANCACDNAGGTRNFGVLFGCEIAGAGAVGGCFPEALTANAGLPLPQVRVQVQCMGAIYRDGSQVPTTLIVKEPGEPAQAPEKKAAELAAALAKFQQQESNATALRRW